MLYIIFNWLAKWFRRHQWIDVILFAGLIFIGIYYFADILLKFVSAYINPLTFVLSLVILLFIGILLYSVIRVIKGLWNKYLPKKEAGEAK